jgi:hypothetical protein
MRASNQAHPRVQEAKDTVTLLVALLIDYVSGDLAYIDQGQTLFLTSFEA